MVSLANRFHLALDFGTAPFSHAFWVLPRNSSPRFGARTGVDLPYHLAIHRVLFDGADPRSILEVLL